MEMRRLCKHCGCQRAAEFGSQYCKRHQSDANARPRKTERKRSSEWHRLYNSRRWRETSRLFLVMNPVCARCGRPAHVADHIQPHRGNEELFYSAENLQPLCWKCHSAKTLAENNYFRDRGDGESKT